MLKLLWYFQTYKNLEQHQISCRDHNHAELEKLQKFKIILNRETNQLVEVAGSIFQHSLQNKSSTVTTSEQTPIEFALVVHYLGGMERQNSYFSYIGENCLHVFIKKVNEILTSSTNFGRVTEMRDDQKKKYKRSKRYLKILRCFSSIMYHTMQ